MINHKDTLNIDFRAIKEALPCFRTKKDALRAGKAYGWNCAVKMQDRFEHFWVVGKRMLADEQIAGVSREHYKLPLLRWDDKHGVKFCPVINLLRLAK